MGNVSELLINTVTMNKPKLLTGLGQKARGRMRPYRLGVRRPQDHR
jgi:hypothetical protein